MKLLSFPMTFIFFPVRCDKREKEKIIKKANKQTNETFQKKVQVSLVIRGRYVLHFGPRNLKIE